VISIRYFVDQFTLSGLLVILTSDCHNIEKVTEFAERMKRVQEEAEVVLRKA